MSIEHAEQPVPSEATYNPALEVPVLERFCFWGEIDSQTGQQVCTRNGLPERDSCSFTSDVEAQWGLPGVGICPIFSPSTPVHLIRKS
jgi:hypothetical protein